MTDQDNLRDRIKRIIDMHDERFFNGDYPSTLSQAIIYEFDLTVEAYVDLGALPDHLQGVWMDDPAFREWEAGQPRKTRIVGKWEE